MEGSSVCWLPSEEMKAAKVLAMRLEESVLMHLSAGEGLKTPEQPSL